MFVSRSVVCVQLVINIIIVDCFETHLQNIKKKKKITNNIRKKKIFKSLKSANSTIYKQLYLMCLFVYLCSYANNLQNLIDICGLRMNEKKKRRLMVLTFCSEFTPRSFSTLNMEMLK